MTSNWIGQRIRKIPYTIVQGHTLLYPVKAHPLRFDISINFRHSTYDPKMPDHLNWLMNGFCEKWKILTQMFFDSMFSCFRSLVECRKVKDHINTIKIRIFVTKPQPKPEVTRYGSADKDMPLSPMSIYAIPYVSSAMSNFQSLISRSFRISKLWNFPTWLGLT